MQLDAYNMLMHIFDKTSYTTYIDIFIFKLIYLNAIRKKTALDTVCCNALKYGHFILIRQHVNLRIYSIIQSIALAS